MEQFNGFCDVYDNGKILSCMRLEYVENTVNLLNELNDKCEFLEIENEALEDGATMYAELCHKLSKENEQLKIRFNEERERSLKFCRNIDALTIENGQLKEEIARQKFSKKIMRANIKDYERAIKRLRKSYEEFDEMRLKRIRFLEKRLKKNGLSIYVNGCGDLE